MSARLDEAMARHNTRPHGQRLEVFPVTRQPESDLMAVARDWYETHDDLAAVAAFAREDGSLDDRDVWEFISEPWHFDHLYVAWRIWIAAENAEDNRVQARLELAA